MNSLWICHHFQACQSVSLNTYKMKGTAVEAWAGGATYYNMVWHFVCHIAAMGKWFEQKSGSLTSAASLPAAQAAMSRFCRDSTRFPCEPPRWRHRHGVPAFTLAHWQAGRLPMLPSKVNCAETTMGNYLNNNLSFTRGIHHFVRHIMECVKAFSWNAS